LFTPLIQAITAIFYQWFAFKPFDIAPPTATIHHQPLIQTTYSLPPSPFDLPVPIVSFSATLPVLLRPPPVILIITATIRHRPVSESIHLSGYILVFSLGLCTLRFVWDRSPVSCGFTHPLFTWVYTPVILPGFAHPLFSVWVYAPFYFCWVLCTRYFPFGTMHPLSSGWDYAPIIFRLGLRTHYLPLGLRTHHLPLGLRTRYFQVCLRTGHFVLGFWHTRYLLWELTHPFI
jgi:hypothetical protein